eukprot:TRINITY_DN1297_c0_g1_i2.p1 TRINITY_DN1297_c0_g1~~TRINITY_DN1297_c0_g1_i2.p1  ORF type:complete len:200 (-),score=31.56 TRINITY_DN1297_c0_g1_i2:256-855(-)
MASPGLCSLSAQTPQALKPGFKLTVSDAQAFFLKNFSVVSCSSAKLGRAFAGNESRRPVVTLSALSSQDDLCSESRAQKMASLDKSPSSSLAWTVGGAALAAFFSHALVVGSLPALALEPLVVTDMEWDQLKALVGVLGGYLFVAPPLIYNYLRLRWYNRSMPETFFQYFLMFFFFPGMLLWAPFLNFRRLPTDPDNAP